MKNIVMSVCYDGSNYFGWQCNKTNKSIEAVVRQELEKLLNHPIKLQAASRTDRGVHASEQIVNFFTEKNFNHDNFQYRINRLLPKDIVITKIEEKESSFHPSLDSAQKTYRYYIYTEAFPSPFINKQVWHFPFDLDIEPMRKAAKELIGKHDFSYFSPQSYKNSRREIFSITIDKKETNYYVITITGDRFLYKMVRCIVGALAYIGSKKESLETFMKKFNKMDRKKATITAPANGLFLSKISYTKK